MVSPSVPLDNLFRITVANNGTPIPSDYNQKEPILNFEGGSTTYNPVTNAFDIQTGTPFSTVLDVDLTTQPDQALTTDGNYTIGGYVWSRQNAVNDQTPMVLTNGVGVVMAPNESADWGIQTSSTRTAPLLRLPFSQVPGLANVTYDTRFRLWLYASFTGAPTFPAGAFAGFDSNDAGFISGVGMCAYQDNGGGQEVVSGAEFNGSTGQWYGLNRETFTTAVVMLDVILPQGVFRPFKGDYASGWPAFSSMVARTQNGALAGGFNDFRGIPAIGSLGLVLAAPNTGAFGTLATFMRVRLDVMG